MNINPDYEYYFFASCPKEIEPFLKQEIEEFEFKITKENDGGLTFQTEFKNIFKFILYSRFSSRVYLQFYQFELDDPNTMDQNIDFDFTDLIHVNDTFKITTLFDQDAVNKFQNSHFISLKLKDTIVDQFKEKLNKRPSIDTKRPVYSFIQRVDRGKRGFKSKLLLDLCGTPLSNRYFRGDTHEAPLRENLAAAIIERVLESKPEVLIDGMCGSGTFILESIIKDLKLPSGFLRLNNHLFKGTKPWAFMNHAWFFKNEDLKDVFSILKRETIEKIDKNLRNDMSFKIIANDIDEEYIRSFKTSLKACKLGGKVEITTGDVFKIDAPAVENKGVFLINPPYGKRMGEVDELRDLYHELGEFFKNNLKKYSCYVFTGNLELRKSISLQTSKRIKFYNGPIECRLFEYDIF